MKCRCFRIDHTLRTVRTRIVHIPTMCLCTCRYNVHQHRHATDCTIDVLLYVLCDFVAQLTAQQAAQCPRDSWRCHYTVQRIDLCSVDALVCAVVCAAILAAMLVRYDCVIRTQCAAGCCGSRTVSVRCADEAIRGDSFHTGNCDAPTVLVGGVTGSAVTPAAARGRADISAVISVCISHCINASVYARINHR